MTSADPEKVSEVEVAPPQEIAVPAVQDGGAQGGVVHYPTEIVEMPNQGERPVLELQGANARLVMRILQGWVENERRRLALSDKRWMSRERVLEVREQERHIQRVEGWLGEWARLSEKK